MKNQQKPLGRFDSHKYMLIVAAGTSGAMKLISY
jgi:hypothetical protein